MSDSESNSNVTVKSTDDTGESACAANPGTEIRRSERKPALSLKAKENKTFELNVDLCSTINDQLSQFDARVQSLIDGVEVAALEKLDDDLANSHSLVLAMYNDLARVSENNILAETDSMYSDYCKSVKDWRESVRGRVAETNAEDQQEQELSQRMIVLKQMLEEQTRQFKEQKQKRMDRAKQRAGLETTTTQITLQSMNSSRLSPLTSDQSNAPVNIPASPRSSSSRIRDQMDSTSLHTDGLTAMERFAETLTNSAQSLAATVVKANSKRTSVEPAVFTGDLLTFIDWEIDLEAYFDAEDIQDKDKLRHLKKYIQGEPLKCVQGLLYTPSAETYARAREKLHERYGDKRDTIKAFKRKITEWPAIRGKDGRGLRDYADYLSHVSDAMTALPALRILDAEEENRKMCDKLPEWIKNSWYREVDRMMVDKDRHPTLAEFSTFIAREARIIIRQTDESTAMATVKGNNGSHRSARTLSTETEVKEKKCVFCEGRKHTIQNCFTLEGKPIEDRIKYVREHRLCFGCLQTGHRSKDCTAKPSCMRCKKRHPTALHDKDWKRNFNKKEPPKNPTPAPPEEVQHAAEVKSTNVNPNRTVYSMSVPVYVSAGGKEKLVYALLDTQSDASFITEGVAKEIGANGKERRLTISTMTGQESSPTQMYNNIQVRGYLTRNMTTIDAYGQQKIRCSRSQIPNTSKCKEIPHLREIADELAPHLDIPVGLLIGADCPEALIQHRTVTGPQGQPFAANTMFGWTLCGGKDDAAHCSSYRIDTSSLQHWQDELQSIDSEKISQEDIQFIKDVEAGTFRNEDGTYVLPLPLKDQHHLPYNRTQAEKRLEQLTARLKSNNQLKGEYSTFVNDLIQNGHAEPVPKNSTAETGSIWYIPHFAVRHPRKKKLRVVFDASAKFKDICLNDVLLSGPDHMNSLIGILCRFRRERIGICCDIERMFYNFYVPEKQRDYLRFLWMDDKLETTKEYRMTVHLFGATSSPAIATSGLRRLASDHASISERAAAFLREDFYVDDGVTSVSTEDEAIRLVKEARAICAEGRVRLHKFISNNKLVLSSIPESERNERVTDTVLFSEQLPNESTLGLKWCTESDCFNFVNNVKTKPATKRGLLSTVGQVYDPLGFLAPFILKGKQIMQKCTASQTGWDEPIDKELIQEWNEWTADLSNLEKISIPRCLKPESMAQVVRAEMHHFCDASLTGYGACSYLRLIDTNDLVHCALLLAKSRVSPLKPVTIPRLELQGAVTAVKLSVLLNQQLKLHIDSEYFWTDSEIVLGYLNNDYKRFHMYVANRVYQIKQNSEAHQWNHVRSEHNPADLTSRGCTLMELKDSPFLRGPHFLKEKDISKHLRTNDVPYPLNDKDDPDVRKVKSLTTSSTVQIDWKQRFAKFSSWKALVRGIAALKIRARNRKWQSVDLTAEDLMRAEEFIIKSVQTDYDQGKPKEKYLSPLNPYVDQSGVMRVGGRLGASTALSQAEMHPAIIPKDSCLAVMLTDHYHRKIHHLGRRSTLAAVRSAGFWIVGGTGPVKKVVDRCAICKRLRGSPEQQTMGQLPPERLESTPPFTHIGVDVFGPFIVRDRRSDLKRWGLLITCLYSRAVHVELLTELSTDAFINALRCFMAIRGPVKTIYSDQGTNFIGARNEFNNLINATTDSKLKEHLLEHKIDFNMNSPHASHQGGVWERLIRSIRAVLEGMATKYKGRLTTESLRTALCEAACIVNGRPMTGSSVTDSTEYLMTPNHLLTMKSQPLTSPPPGKFDEDEVYGRKRWRVVQRFAEEFWTAWKADYLRHLTVKQKWPDASRNLQTGDIVIVKDSDTSRNFWKIGRVSKVMPGSDGKVRNIEVTMGNSKLDNHGKPMSPPTILTRPIQQVVILLTV